MSIEKIASAVNYSVDEVRTWIEKKDKGVANGSSLNNSSNLYAMTEQSSRFYHGFVLGLIVELSDKYEVKSNRESGFGSFYCIYIIFLRWGIWFHPFLKQSKFF